MSTEVDQKVVEMRFDNKHFEANVAQSMSTLDKLKHALNLDGASKGLENVNSAANKVNMSGLSNGVEEVKAKFSAMEVVAVTALANITNSAVNAGKNLVKSLSVDQITSGWGKYDQKTANVQTLMNATGLAVDEVNGYLEKLMWFSDETSYSFTDMTSGLATMVSSGGDIKKLVPMLMGVANATAFAGKGAAEFSRVLQYGVNQAYSLGYMQVQDWKTIEGATVNSKQLMESLIAAGEALGTIKKGQIDTSNFRSSLKDQWLTKDVMEKGFGYFAEMSEKAYEMVNSGEVETASDAYAILSKQYDTVSLTAAKAAQEAKTFQEAIDATKDAVSSGWMKSFEIIFGNYEQAKVTWTRLANWLWDVFAAGAEIRNAILESAFAKNFQAIGEKLQTVLEPLSATTDGIKGMVSGLKDYNTIVEEIIAGDWGTMQKRWDALTEAGYDWKHAQNLVNEELGCSLRRATDYKETQDTVKESTEELTETEVERLEQLIAMSDAELEALGYEKEQIKALRDLEKTAKKLGMPIDELLKNLDEIDGRWLFVESFANIGKSISGILQAIKTAWSEVFNPEGVDMIEKISDSIFNVLTAFYKFSRTLLMVDEETGELNETGQKFVRIFKGVFAVIDLVITTLKGPLKLAFAIIKEILGIFGVSFLEILARIGDGLVKFSNIVNKILSAITNFVVEHIGKWIAKFKETEFFKTTADWFAKASERISAAVGNISNKIDNFSASGFGKALKAIGGFIAVLAKRVANSKVVTFAIDGIRWAFEKLKNFFATFKLPTFSLDSLKMFLSNITNVGKNIKGSEKGGVAGVVDGIGKTLGNHKRITTAKKNFEKGIESFFTKFVEFWLKIGGALKKAFAVCKDALKGIIKFIFGTEEIDMQIIMDAVQKFLTIIALFKVIKLMDTFVAPLENITSALDNIANSLKWKAIGDAFKAMALALGVLTACIVVLANIDDMKKAWQAAGMLAAMLVVMGGIIVGLGWLSGKMGGLDTKSMFTISISLLLVVAAIALMVKSLKDIDNLKLNDPLKTFGYLAAVLLALAFGVKLVSKAANSNFAAIAGLLTLVGALKLILEVITAYDEYNWADKGDAILRIVEMLVILALAVNLATRGVKAGTNIKGLAMVILAMVVGIRLLVKAIEDINAMDEAAIKKGMVVITHLLGLMTVMMAVANTTSKGTKLKKGEKSVNNFTGLAIALLAVCGAIWFLGRMDVKTLTQGGIAISFVLGMMTAILAVLGKNCKGLKTRPIIAMILGFGLLMAEMAIIIKKLDGVSWQSKASTFVAVGGMLVIMAGVLKVLTKSRVKAKKVYTWVGALVALGLVIGLLAHVIKILKDVNPITAIGNTTALAGLLAAMAGVFYMLSGLDMRKLSNKKLIKLGLAFAVMGGILAGLAAVLLIVKDVNPLTAIGNAIALSALLAAISGVLYVVGGMKTTNISTNIIVAMVILAAIVGGLAAVLYAIRNVDPVSALGNATALSELLIVITGAMAACAALSKTVGNNIGGFYAAAGGIAALGIVVAELAAVLKYTKDLDPKTAIGNAKALSELMTVLTGVMSACALFGKLVGKNQGGFWSAAGSIGALGVVVLELGWICSIIKKLDMSGVESDLKIIAQLMVALCGVLFACALIGIVMTSTGWMGIAGTGIAIGSLSVLGLVVLELGWVCSVIKKMAIGGIESEVLLITNLLYDLVDVLAACSIIGLIAPFSTGAILNIALLGLVVLELGAILSVIKGMNIGGMESEVKVLSMLLYNLVPVLAACTLLGIGAAFAVGGISALALLGLVVVELGAFLCLMKDWGIGAMMPTVIVLSVLLHNLVPVLAACTICGLAAPAAYAGIGALITLIASLEVLIITLGALMSIPALQNFVDTGIEALIKLAGGIGEMTGAFGAGLSSGLPEIGSNLGSFMTNASPFFTMITSIDSGMLGSVKALAGMILTLTEASLLDSITRFLGGSSFDSFGDQLVSFGRAVVSFSSIVSGNIDSAAVEAAANAGKMMASFAQDIPNSGGVLGFIMGNNDMNDFGAQLVPFGTAMVRFSSIVAGKIDQGAVEAAATAGLTMVGLAKDIPNSGGVLGFIMGNNDMNEFGAQLVPFGTAIVRFSSIVAGKIDQGAVEAAANAGLTMTGLAKDIPNSGGVLGFIMGNNDMNDFGAQLVPFGTAIVRFSSIVAGNIDSAAVEAAANVGSMMVELNNSLENSGGVVSWFTGDNTLDKFGEQIVSFAESMVKFSDTVSGNIDKDAMITAVNSAFTAVTTANNLPDSIDFATLDTGLNSLAESMIAFSEKISGKLDLEAISVATTAGKTIAEAASVMPEEVDLAKLTNGLDTFGTSIVKFSEIVSGEGIDTEAITTATTAGTQIVDMLKNIPPSLDLVSFTDGMSLLGPAMKSFVDTVKWYDDEVIGKVTDFGSSIATMLAEFPDYIDITDACTNLPALGTAISSFVTNVQSISTDNLDNTDKVVETGKKIAGMIKEIPDYIDMVDFSTNLPQLATALVSFTTNAKGIDTETAESAATAGKKITGMLKDIPDYVDIADFNANLPTLATTLSDFATDVAGIDTETVEQASAMSSVIAEMLKTIAESGISTYITAFTSATTNTSIVTAISTMITNTINAVKTQANYDSFSAVGSYLVDGFVAGINTNAFKATNAGKAIAKAAYDAAKKQLDVNSPSKVFRKLGTSVPEGFIMGIEKLSGNVANSASGMADTAINSTVGAVARVAAAISTDIDSQPTIRPVLDLSDVESGAATLGSMLNLNSSVGVRANVGAITASMANRQNGDSELISAIDKLAKSNSKSGDTYQINGISYNEDSDVAGAIQTLVRAAIMEGRT